MASPLGFRHCLLHLSLLCKSAWTRMDTISPVAHCTRFLFLSNPAVLGSTHRDPCARLPLEGLMISPRGSVYNLFSVCVCSGTVCNRVFGELREMVRGDWMRRGSRFGRADSFSAQKIALPLLSTPLFSLRCSTFSTRSCVLLSCGVTPSKLWTEPD